MRPALTIGSGYQYAVFYLADTVNASVRHPSISRRAITGEGTKKGWESFSFMDYDQTDDDGHDTWVL